MVACYILREVIGLELHFGPYLRTLHWRMDQNMSNALAKMDLTSAQGHLMGYLVHRKEPPCPRDVEEEFHLSHPTVSGLLSRMEKKGFIECRPDPNDRRSKRIFILPRGWECHAQIHQTILDNEARMVQGFTPAERALFFEFLGRAIANVGGTACPCSNKEEHKL